MADLNTQTGLAEAIQYIQGSAQAALAVEERTVKIEVDDRGEKVSFPVVMAPNGQMTSLLGHVQLGTAFAREERLRYAAGPDARQGTAKLQSLASFIDPAGRKLVSVLDYHAAGADSPARWGRHRGIYECPLSEAWTAWGGGTALELDQDAEPMQLEVRLRATVEDGAAQFTVQIHAAGDVLRDAFAMLGVRVEEETKLPLFQGTPE